MNLPTMEITIIHNEIYSLLSKYSRSLLPEILEAHLNLVVSPTHVRSLVIDVKFIADEYLKQPYRDRAGGKFGTLEGYVDEFKKIFRRFELPQPPPVQATSQFTPINTPRRP